MNAALDVAIGLMLMYLVLSPFCTAINEFVANMMALRAKTLNKTLSKLIDNEDLKLPFYNHGLIGGSKAASSGGAAVKQMPASNIRDAMIGCIAVAKATSTRCAAMDRLSGAYKHNLQTISIIVGLCLAVALNADTVDVGAALWKDPSMAAGIGQSASQFVASPTAKPQCAADPDPAKCISRR